MSKIITLRQLDAKGACQDQRNKFKEIFGSQVEVTLDLCIKHAQDFDFNWAVNHLLSSTARAEYERVTASASLEYTRVTAPAWAEDARVRASAWAEYERVTASARAEYARVRAPARAEYERVKASAFFHAWEQDNG